MAKADPLKVVQDSPGLRERTTQVLRQAILSAHFSPGEKLVERKLCDATGVSRTCVREAVRHLEAEGLVRRERNRGIFVSGLTPEDAVDIYAVRKMLEVPLLGDYARRATEQQRNAVHAALRAVKKNLAGDRSRHGPLIDELVGALWIGAGNRVAIRLQESLAARISYIRVLLGHVSTAEERQRTVAILGEVVDALDRDDVAAAQDRYTFYLERALERTLGILREGDIAAV